MVETITPDTELLKQAVETGATVQIYFVNGFQTAAKIKGFGNGAIIAEVRGKPWTIFAHAVSTIAIL